MAMKSPLLNCPPMVLYLPAQSPRRDPPPLRRDRSPYARIPLPAVHDHGDRCHTTLTSIHPLLQSSPKPTLKFDLHHPPSSIALPRRSLSEPATHPPLPCPNISTHLLPYSIVVLPSRPHLPNSFVTVSDVLRTLHRALSMGLTHDELDELPSEDIRSQVKAVYERRVRAHPDWRTRELEKRWGIRRIDLLLGQTRFLGLSVADKRRDVLVLNIC
jgi:hypothetical protein